jgi:MFS family permease
MEKEASKKLIFFLQESICFFLSGSLFSPILPLHILDLGADKFQLGLIMTISRISSTILRVPVGMVTDRLGQKLTMAFGILSRAVSTIIYSSISSLTWFYPAAIFHNSSEAAFRPAAHAAASSLAPTPTTQGRIMGIYLTTIGIALMVGPLLCSILLRSFDFRQVFMIVSTLPSIALVIFIVCYPLADKTIIRKRGMERIEMLRSLRRIVVQRNMLLFCVISAAFNFSCYGVFTTFLNVYMKEFLLLSPETISLLFAVQGLASTMIRIPVGHVSDKVGRKGPSMVGFMLFTSAVLLITTQNEYHCDYWHDFVWS